MPLKLIPTSPKKSLNAAFLKVRPLRSEIDAFKANLINLLDKVDEYEREENQKTHVRDFLVNTYFKGKNEVNTKGHIDLVIHTENNNKSSVAVIIEAKRPSNKSEWISAAKPNGKGLQELVLYYMRERVEENNIDVKHLVLTNIYEWYIIDAAYFDKLFYQNKKFVKEYQAWSAGQKVSADTALFYTDIAKPMIESIDEEIPCTYFDLRSYEKELRNDDTADDKKLIELQKLLSEYHLLKVPFANDSNKLDKKFYSELLHIIGLTEIKDGGKKLIGRHKEGERMIGSILEDTIMQLDARDKLGRVKNASQYGSSTDEKLFNIALELTITWVNRILFLKLLEGQLLSYHKGDKSYLFLNHQVIREFDQLDALFFQVLAKRFDERNEHVRKTFDHVPYLNSSLFEPTDLEHDTLFISNLSDDKTIPIHTQTVLKSANGSKRSGELSTLEYLFAFLDAYDFSGEGSEDIQEDNKPLINASVLGLIFEKINGYKDGSFFTPGFITMYMCRETIRRAVVQKFNESKNWKCETIDDLYDKIEDRAEANGIINSIKICDPAVGSGHFLVSALNEMIAIKSDLKVLQDREGKRLKEYVVEVVNDELIIKDIDGELYQYHPLHKESQRVQEALFHEKQTIIENCLFGVDINANSVKICRLRLWIELLKNAYYKNKTELETLPNIDINIKCGNSLVSRFAIDADMKDVLKKAKKWNIQSYKLAVDGYRNAKTKEEKREFESLIDHIKTDFKSEVDKPFMKKISEARGKAEKIAMDITNLTAFGQKIDTSLKKNLEAATATLTKLEAEREDILQNKIYENAFEWRFEFPEVLNDEGDFVGFDVVIGNPPYIPLEAFEINERKFFNNKYTQLERKYETSVPFIIEGLNILNLNGHCSYIAPVTWQTGENYVKFRTHFFKNFGLDKLINLPFNIFEDAYVDTALYFISKKHKEEYFIHAFNKKAKVESLDLLKYSEFSIKELKSPEFKIILDKTAQRFSNFSSPGFVEFGSITISTQGLSGSNFPESNNEKSQYIFPFLSKGNVYNYCLVKESIYNTDLADKKNLIQFYQANPKILIRRIISRQDRLSVSFCKEKLVFKKDINPFIPINENFDCYFLTGIIASKLISFIYLNSSSIATKDDFRQTTLTEIRKLPIPNIDSASQIPISEKVKEIMNIKSENYEADTSTLESQIDQMVYELYGLTEEEIKIVEGR